MNFLADVYIEMLRCFTQIVSCFDEINLIFWNEGI